jgi:crotonobetainyl-CoA:carnitine CoA-transferase CaiB-like acyl-CoA transferase
MKAAPLAGTRVLDLSTMIAAPLAASLMSDWGASVIKVEQPGHGDHVRRFGAQSDGQGLYWKTLSRGKRSLAIDLHNPAGQDLVRRLASTHDVLIENFRPGTLERWNLGPSVLHEANPSLVILRMTAFGQFGPYRTRAGFGTLAEAMSGIAAVTGFADRPPLLPALPLADVLAGFLSSSAVLAALLRRARDGSGETIDFAIYEAALKAVELQVLEYDANGTLHTRHGNQIEDAAPRGAYRCGDGRWIALSGSTQAVAERVLRTIGGDELVNDPRFKTNVERVENSDALDKLIDDWCAQRTREVTLETFSAMGCAVGPLESIDTMLENEQVIARGSIATVDDPDLGPLRMTNVYPRFEETPLPVPPPGDARVGEQTREILQDELGLTGAEIDRLFAAGTVA